MDIRAATATTRRIRPRPNPPTTTPIQSTRIIRAPLSPPRPTPLRALSTPRPLSRRLGQRPITRPAIRILDHSQLADRRSIHILRPMHIRQRTDPSILLHTHMDGHDRIRKPIRMITIPQRLHTNITSKFPYPLHCLCRLQHIPPPLIDPSPAISVHSLSTANMI